MELDFSKLDSDLRSGKNIYLQFSGGSDSAIFLAILAKRYPDVKVTLLTVKSSPLYVAQAIAIHDKYFPQYEHRFIECPEGVEVIRPVVRDYCQQNGLNPNDDLIYTCITRVPDVKLDGRPPVRMTDEQLAERPAIRAPFLHMDKIEVTKLADEYAPEGMLELTQSCATTRPHCEQPTCFPCAERKWAFNACGYDMDGRRL